MRVVDLPPPPASRAATGVLCGAAMRDICLRRVEQVDAYGFSPAYDMGFGPDALGRGAINHVQVAMTMLDLGMIRREPGFDPRVEARRALVEAATLVWAMIDRLDAEPATAAAAANDPELAGVGLATGGGDMR